MKVKTVATHRDVAEVMLTEPSRFRQLALDLNYLPGSDGMQLFALQMEAMANPVRPVDREKGINRIAKELEAILADPPVRIEMQRKYTQRISRGRELAMAARAAKGQGA